LGAGYLKPSAHLALALNFNDTAKFKKERLG